MDPRRHVELYPDFKRSNEEYKEYLKKGGTVKTIAPELGGKTPGASPQNQIMADWNIDDLMGFGYSNIFMEELDLEYNHGGFDVG